MDPNVVDLRHWSDVSDISVCCICMLYLYAVSVWCSCMLYLYVVSVCYICMLYLYAVSVCYICMLYLYLYAVSVCCICMLYMYAVFVWCICMMYLYDVSVCCICMLYLYDVSVCLARTFITPSSCSLAPHLYQWLLQLLLLQPLLLQISFSVTKQNKILPQFGLGHIKIYILTSPNGILLDSEVGLVAKGTDSIWGNNAPFSTLGFQHFC